MLIRDGKGIIKEVNEDVATSLVNSGTWYKVEDIEISQNGGENVKSNAETELRKYLSGLTHVELDTLGEVHEVKFGSKDNINKKAELLEPVILGKSAGIETEAIELAKAELVKDEDEQEGSNEGVNDDETEPF